MGFQILVKTNVDPVLGILDSYTQSWTLTGVEAARLKMRPLGKGQVDKNGDRIAFTTQGGQYCRYILILLFSFSVIWSGCVEKKNRFEIDPVAWNKFDQNLKKAVESVQGDPTIEWPVAITLAPPAGTATSPAGTPDRETRKRMAQERQAAFEMEAAGLVEVLKQQGAQEIQLFWINRSISARAKLPALEVIGQRDEVSQIVLAVRQKVIATPGNQ